MKKYADTVELYNMIRQKLKNVLTEISLVDYIESENRWYVPCNKDSCYLLYTISHNKYCYWYFYHLESRDKDFSIETDNSVNVMLDSIFSCTVFDSKNVLIHDILSRNNKIVRVEYPLRYNLLIETIGVDSIKINKQYNIKVSIKLNEQVDLQVFRNNFKYSCEYFLCVWNSYRKDLVKLETSNINKDLLIKCGIKSEIYHVYDTKTNEDFGLLYIKKLEDSRYIFNLLKNESEIVHVCKWNERFRKWELVR